MALRGTATQSTTYSESGYRASPFVSYANDGNIDTNIVQSSETGCSLTEPTPPVWWQVDLLKVFEITKVAITGRDENGKCVTCTAVIGYDLQDTCRYTYFGSSDHSEGLTSVHNNQYNLQLIWFIPVIMYNKSSTKLLY